MQSDSKEFEVLLEVDKSSRILKVTPDTLLVAVESELGKIGLDISLLPFYATKEELNDYYLFTMHVFIPIRLTRAPAYMKSQLLSDSAACGNAQIQSFYYIIRKTFISNSILSGCSLEKLCNTFEVPGPFRKRHFICKSYSNKCTSCFKLERGVLKLERDV